MAKQKIVVKVMMKNDKSPRKAMQVAVSVSGVESVALLDKERIAVTGEQIDSVELTCLLRKSVGHADLVSVGPVEEKKTVKDIPIPQPVPVPVPVPVRYEYVIPPEHYLWNAAPFPVVNEVAPSICSIL